MGSQSSGAPAGEKLNHIGRPKADYRGLKSTLCAGCGHDAITNALIQACWEAGVEPWRVAKASGIGCSSKTPAYFLSQSHGINGCHGRMPSLATGAFLANRGLTVVGVSGDGDTASIGIGQFIHTIRRNVPMLYIIEDNGVYGLTKGQFSATADEGSVLKSGAACDLEAIDCCALAVELGCAYVARSFSGDQKQLVPLIKGALSHRGTAVIDVLSPCVTFNNHEGSTRSYSAVRDGEIPLHEIGFIPSYQPIHVDYEPGTVAEVKLFDGSVITLRKLDRNYDPTNRMEALRTLYEAHSQRRHLTGLFYVNPAKAAFDSTVNLVDEPLATLPQNVTRPSREVLAKIMKELG